MSPVKNYLRYCHIWFVFNWTIHPPFFLFEKLNTPPFLCQNWAPPVMRFFLENSEVSQIQNKDVAAAAAAAAAAAVAAWLTLTYVLQSELLWATPFHLVAISADESLSSFWVRCSCLCGEWQAPLMALLYLHIKRFAGPFIFGYLCQIEKGNFTKLVSGWHGFRPERCNPGPTHGPLHFYLKHSLNHFIYFFFMFFLAALYCACVSRRPL